MKAGSTDQDIRRKGGGKGEGKEEEEEDNFDRKARRVLHNIPILKVKDWVVNMLLVTLDSG